MIYESFIENGKKNGFIFKKYIKIYVFFILVVIRYNRFVVKVC